MRFSSVALAATVSAASTPAVANVGSSAAEPKFFTSTAMGSAVTAGTFNWAKGYGGGLAQTSKIVEVDASKDQDLTFSAVWTGAQTADNCKKVTIGTPPGTIDGEGTGKGADSAEQKAAALTHDAFLALTWKMKKFAEGDAEAATEGSVDVAVKTEQAWTQALDTTDGTKSTCTAAVVYTVKKDSKNVVVTKLTAKGITLGDTGAFATVSAVQATAGIENPLGQTAAASPADCATLVGGGSVTDKTAACAKGGLGVYSKVQESGAMFLWGITIGKASTTTTATNTTDAKKSATTLAIGAAAGLVAAAIA